MDKPAANNFPILDPLRTRWSPRAFADRPVEPAKLRSALEAARWAPSSYNEQPWAFVVGTKDDPAEYARVLDCLVPFNQEWAKLAPVLILTAARTSFARNGKPNGVCRHDLGQAVMSLTVQATADGLALHQMAGIEADKVRSTFGLPPEWEPLTGIALGYPGEPDRLQGELQDREYDPRTRKELGEFVFTGSWGTPAAVVKGGE